MPNIPNLTQAEATGIQASKLSFKFYTNLEPLPTLPSHARSEAYFGTYQAHEGLQELGVRIQHQVANLWWSLTRPGSPQNPSRLSIFNMVLDPTNT